MTGLAEVLRQSVHDEFCGCGKSHRVHGDAYRSIGREADDWFAARLAVPAVVEAVASASLIHGTCHTQDGTSARPVMCRCGTAMETFGVWHRHRANAALAAITTALSAEETK